MQYCRDERLDPTRMGDTDIIVHVGVNKPATLQVIMHRFTLPSPNVLKLESIANLPVPPARLASVNVSLRYPHPPDPRALSLGPTHLLKPVTSATGLISNSWPKKRVCRCCSPISRRAKPDPGGCSAGCRRSWHRIRPTNRPSTYAAGRSGGSKAGYRSAGSSAFAWCASMAGASSSTTRLQRLITCAHCNHVVTGEKMLKTPPNGTKREYSYYRCSRYGDKGHPRVRLTEQQIDPQLKACFATIRIEDATERQWFVDVIKAKAHTGHDQNRQHQKELLRQREQVNAKLQTLLDLRMDGEITADDYATKRQELHDRQNAIALQLQTSDRDGREIADLAIKAFELSQSLREKWIKADYQAKRTILGIMLKSVRLNSENLEFYPKKTVRFAAGGEVHPAQWSDGESNPDLLNAIQPSSR
jgi:hypothetical protein